MLARQYLREIWWIMVGYLIILEGAMIAAILYWPQFRDNIPAIAKLVPFQALQDLLAQVEHAGYWPYFAIQHWFKGCSLFGVAAIAFMGSGLIAREADQRTAEFLLSRPVSRRRILLTRFAVLGLAVVAPVYITSITAIWISPAVDEYIGWGETLIASSWMSLFLLMLCGLCTLLSALSTNQFRAGALLVGFILVNFAVYLVQSLDRFSLFKTIDVWAFMEIHLGKTPWFMMGLFATITLVQFAAADLVFRRRMF
ncbi:MAG: ABC transporter permease [Phycisphaerales bacterium]|nr:ABC transporter permease [Phycisphaerales bacterium]